jgi:hypothetical protein
MQRDSYPREVSISIFTYSNINKEQEKDVEIFHNIDLDMCEIFFHALASLSTP